MIKFLEKYGFWISVVICFLIYLALAYKNPFKDNNLISNLEPYPDTILYSFPAWNFVRGNGWNLGVGEKIVDITVPNTYGILLVPLMWVFNDIRSFYFTNLIFGVGALMFFMLALKNFFGKEKWYLIGYLGFLLATNFYFFNQPQLVMAENVNYLLVAMFLYLLSLRFKWKHLIWMIILSGFTLIIKQTNLVLGGSFVLSFGLKILFEKRKNINLKKIFIIFLLLGLLALSFYLPRIFNLNSDAFNFKFFKSNFGFYLECLKGGYCRNLWYGQRLITWDVILLSVLGFGILSFDKKKKYLMVTFLVPIILMTLAMSIFRDTEGRHIEILVPIILVFSGFAINKINSKFEYPVLIIILLFGINLFFSGYQANNNESKIISLKKQVGLNFRHREDPWNYICLKYFDNFIKDKPDSIFGSFLPIYFFDSYGVKTNYLPLSGNQDFMNGRGLKNYFPVPLKNIYQEKLDEGKEIYLSDYYASNGRDAWRKEWEEIVSVGELEKVWQSPLDNCNIYKLVKSRKL